MLNSRSISGTATSSPFLGASPASRECQRRGVTLVEVMAAAAMLAVLLTSAVHVLRVIATEHRAADRRALALQTVQNLAEQVGNTPWAAITPEGAEKLMVPTSVKAYLPEAKLAATVIELHEPVAAKRVSLELTWNAPNGQAAAPARLTVWAFPQELSVH